MCRIDLCGQIGVKISSYGDRKFIKINPLNRPWGRFLRREDILLMYLLAAFVMGDGWWSKSVATF